MKSLWLNLLKVLIAAALAVWVIHQIEFQDHISGPREAGASAPAREGRIVGDWHGDAWTFTAKGGQVFRAESLPPGWELRPGFFTILAGIRWGFFALSQALWVVLLLLVSWRWQILLRAAGVTTHYLNSLRLCFVGYFFNNVLPGLTGGDIVRAVLVTRGLETNRAKAAVSVIVDRIIGLFALVFLAGVVLAVGGRSAARARGVEHIDQLASGVNLFLAATLLLGGLYLSRRVRRFLHLDALLAHLPGRNLLAKIDDAITVYRAHPLALFSCLAISLALQSIGVVAIWVLGKAMGASLTLGEYFIIVPVVQTVSSVPLSPAGWGVGEALFGKMFTWFRSSLNLGVALSVAFRLTQVGYGLLGGLAWILSKEHREGVRAVEAAASVEAVTSMEAEP
ncbi:MAG: lysylphosphatidylglycerol synthase transmembrane domain-containing protein [Planctomycetota bacterium]